VDIGYADGLRLILSHVRDIDERTEPGFDPNLGIPVQGPTGRTALHTACELGEHYFAKALLKRGADRVARDSNGHTPLHVAAFSGHLSCVLQLLGKAGRDRMPPADVNAVDFIGATPLHTGAAQGSIQVCKALVAAGARKDVVTLTQSTPLELAMIMHSGNAALLELLAVAPPAVDPAEDVVAGGEAATPGASCEQCGAGIGLKACGGCYSVVYCGPACSSAAWPGHKSACKARIAARSLLRPVRNIKDLSDLPPSSASPRYGR